MAECSRLQTKTPQTRLSHRTSAEQPHPATEGWSWSAKPKFTSRRPIRTCNWARCPTVPLTSVILPAAGADDILGRMSDQATKPARKLITAQNMDEAKTAAYANDPQTELVILGLSENVAVTTCGWARRFFDGGGLNLF